jgi:type VI secretion system protein ImpD/type VI secretion system protein ImpC
MELAERLPPDEAAASATALRNAVLEGRLLGREGEAGRAGLADFLFAPSAQALWQWFGPTPPCRVREALDRDIAAIDALISAQLDAILHHPRLQRLEGRWRGVEWLTALTKRGRWNRVKLRILNVGWSELARDVARAAEFDQSETFRKIYDEEFGTAGGEPYGVMVVDHELRHMPAPGAPTDDVDMLKQLSGVAAAAFMPMVFGAAPELLGLDSFSVLERVQDAAGALFDEAHGRWNTLGKLRDTEFLAVALPRVLARLPWEDDGRHGMAFRYAEYAPTVMERTWTSAGFAFAAVAARAFAEHGWPADVRGADPDRVGGGLVTELPIEWFRTDPPGVWPRLPLEVVLTDAQERALAEAGLMPLGALPFGIELLFGVVRSLRRPDRHVGPQAEAADINARLSVQINSVLCASRFAHHLKVMARDMVGSVTTAEAIERRLQDWLTQYVNGSLSTGPEMRARCPLVQGRVEVWELQGRPGAYGCTMHLQPHFQLDDIGATFSLTTEIARPSA